MANRTVLEGHLYYIALKHLPHLKLTERDGSEKVKEMSRLVPQPQAVAWLVLISLSQQHSEKGQHRVEHNILKYL